MMPPKKVGTRLPFAASRNITACREKARHFTLKARKQLGGPITIR